MNPKALKDRCLFALANRLGAGGPFRTYRLNPPEKSITCLVCGRTSFNQMDVSSLYCNHCHNFHEPGLQEAPQA